MCLLVICITLFGEMSIENFSYCENWIIVSFLVLAVRVLYTFYIQSPLSDKGFAKIFSILWVLFTSFKVSFEAQKFHNFSEVQFIYLALFCKKYLVSWIAAF